MRKMTGNSVFFVLCALVSVFQLAQAQPPYRFRPPTSSPFPPTPYGIINEIYGSSGGPATRPPPGVLIAGYGPPVSRPRPRGLFASGARSVPLFSTSTPIPSPWPTYGPQIQRAREASHFEYEVFPHPMSHPRPQPSPRTRRPLAPVRVKTTISPPSHYPPAPVPPELLRVLAQDVMGEVTPSTRPQSRTDRPPVGIIGRNPPVSRFPPASSADFQEGFRILSDLFMDDSGPDIRSNLVGGSDISIGGNYYPIASINAATASRGNASTIPIRKPANAPSQTPVQKPDVQITPAQEHNLSVPVETRHEEPKAPVKSIVSPQSAQPQTQSQRTQQIQRQKSQQQKPQQMEQAESAYGPPHWQPGPPSHVSFMYTDPSEAIVPGYSLYDSEYGGPPPPFHSSSNSIIPPSHREPDEVVRDTDSPPAQNDGGTGGYSLRTPEGNSVRQQNDHVQSLPQMPLMMMPMSPMASSGNSNEPPPSSEEVQKALNILTRYASKQMTQMGISMPMSMSSPQIMQIQASPNPEYGPPKTLASSSMQTQSSPMQPMTMTTSMQTSGTPSTEYGTPQQQQSTTIPSYLPPSSVTSPPNEPSQDFTIPMQGPSTHFGSTTTEAADAITITSGGLTEESSPYPAYGPPGFGFNGGMNGMSNGGGWGQGDSGGGGGSGSSGGGGTGPVGELVGAKVQALKTIQSAVTGGFRQITGLKAGILNAGLNAIGNLGRAKGDLANSLKIPIVSPKPSYGPPMMIPMTSPPTSSYGPPPEQQQQQQPKQPGPVGTLINGVREVVGGIAGTVAQTGRAAVGIGLSKNQFVKNHFAIKGQAFTETVSKKIANKNQYFQNVLKHVQSIFDSSGRQQPSGGWAQRRRRRR